MFELLQKMIAFKYSCKVSHWRTEDYSMHLLYDRLQEDMDEMVDDLAEKYFMAHNQKSQLTVEIFKTEYINKDLTAGIKGIIDHIENLLADGKLSQGMQSMLSGMAETFLGKLALIGLK